MNVLSELSFVQFLENNKGRTVDPPKEKIDVWYQLLTEFTACYCL